MDQCRCDGNRYGLFNRKSRELGGVDLLMAGVSPRSGLEPIPSLLWAAATDEGDRQMRRGGRKAWSESDYLAAIDKLRSLVVENYGVEEDSEDGCFHRFQEAARAERGG